MVIRRFKIIALFLAFLENVDTAVGAAIIASMATIMVGVSSALATQYQINRHQIEDAHREKKIQIYEDFMNMAAAHLAQENENIKQRKIQQKELVKFFLKFKTGLILWGSPGVIKAMGDFEGASESDGDVLGAVDEIYRQIRKDVG